MQKRLLLKAACRHQFGSLLCAGLLLFLVALSGFSSLALWTSGERAVSAEMDRLGFGDLTVWVNANEEPLQGELLRQSEVDNVTVQPLIFSAYQANGHYSDDEGQIIVYDGSVPYRFVQEDGTDVSVATITAGKVYVSPSLRSSFDLQIGDTITFDLTCSNGQHVLTVSGYFEDAFMGSSMIDMKSFLISADDREMMLNQIAASPEYDQMAHTGAMLHIWQKEGSSLSAAEFSRKLNAETALSVDTVFSYSKGLCSRFSVSGRTVTHK